MGWKDWPAWLKGGLLFGLLHLFWTVYLILGHYVGGKDTTMGLFVFDLPLAIIGDLTLGSQLENYNTFFLYYGIFGTLMYFAVGVFIFWIIGKILNFTRKSLKLR